VQVRLLGPIDVLTDGGPHQVRGLRRKAVLATLALRPGQVVGTDRLLDAVWGAAAPVTAMNTLQSHVSHLRHVLGSKAAILARPPGYVLELGGESTDVQLAERLLRRGSQSADPAEAVRQLRTALALWRGRSLADVTGLPWLEQQAERLDLLFVQVQLALAEARLAAGEHAQLAPGLEQLAADHPLDERICGQLMLALYRSGRQADALAAYHRLRRTLDAELGIDPGQPLRDLETAILRQDRAIEAPPSAVMLAAPVPAQLPPAVPVFAGRDAELASLDAMLSAAGGHHQAGPATVVLSAVSGSAGVGKTALAVHWAHQVAACFPDGQLYVNLRGFDPDGAAMSPAVAVRGFLDALGMPAARIPASLDGQAGLYRSLLAGKRVLVLLDNARDVDQVRPLLPGSPGCLAIVTSRGRLTGLVAAEGALPLTLDLLSADGARDLLSRRIGAARISAEPQAAQEIIERCARLPLALTIAAARVATSPGFPLGVFADELRESTRPLDLFDSGDLATDVRAVFSWSYRALSAGAARLFRLLGLHNGPDIGPAAVASLAGIGQERARALLAELASAHLLAERSPGRYACHDLLRAYASELAHAQESQRARDAAVRGILDHYLHTAHLAAMLMRPTLSPITLEPPQHGAIIGRLKTADDALNWFTAEEATLLAAVRLAADAGLEARSWQLAWSLTTYLLRLGLWNDQIMTCRTGLEAACRSGDQAGQANSLHGLASGYARAGNLSKAQPYFMQALRRFEAVGDQAGQATMHNSLTVLAERRRRPAEMLSHSLRALELYRAAGHRPGQAWVLNNIGYSHALLGDYAQALGYCQRAMAATQELGERCWEAATWHSLAYISHKLGDHGRAITCYHRSLALCLELSDRYNEAATLDHIGGVHRGMGDTEAASRAWTRALRIFDEIGHPDADLVQGKLRGLREQSRVPDRAAEGPSWRSNGYSTTVKAS